MHLGVIIWILLPNLLLGYIFNYTDHKNNVMTNYLIDLINYYVDDQKAGFLSFIINNSSRNEMIDDVTKHIHLRSEIKVLTMNLGDGSYKETITELSMSSNYLGYLILQFIFTNTTENIVNSINETENFNIFNTRSKIITITDSSIDETKLYETYVKLWSKKYINIITLYDSEDNIISYTYNPFLVKLENFTNVSVDKLFYNKFRNFNRQNFTFLLLREDDVAKSRMKKHNNGTIYFTGIEVELFKNIADYYNASMVVKCADIIVTRDGNAVNPWRQYNEVVDGTELKKKIIEKEKIDMIVSEGLITSEKEVTMGLYPHSSDHMMVLIKKADKIPHYLYLLLIFKPETWYLFLITLTIGTLTWITIGKDYNQFFNIIRMTTGGSLPEISTNNPEKIFIIFWLLYSLIIITAFVSNLTTALINEKYYEEIDTIDQLIKSDLVLSLYKTQLYDLLEAFNGTSKFPYFNKSVITPERYVLTNIRLINYTSFLFDYIPFHPILVNYERCVIIVRMKGVSKVLRMMKESPLPNYLAYKLPYNSPLVDDINLILRRIVEGGFYIHWKRMHMHDLTITGYIEQEVIGENKIRALSIQHFQAAYISLFIGLGVSFIVFILELMSHM